MVPGLLDTHHLGGPGDAIGTVLRSARLDLVLLTPESLRGLVDRKVERIAGAPVAERWARENEWLFRLRLEQIEREPGRAPWIVRAMVHRVLERIVGSIGFHGPPGSNALGDPAAVEFGFRVEPEFRRQGYASESVVALMDWARHAHDVRRFLASVSPSNAPSLALVRKLGFLEVTRVIDEEDGEEIVFERRSC